MINNLELETKIREYKKGDFFVEEDLVKIFNSLIDSVIDYKGWNINRDSFKEDCVDLLLLKTDRYNPDKGKAFNFFTSIILCSLRQEYRKNQRLNK